MDVSVLRAVNGFPAELRATADHGPWGDVADETVRVRSDRDG